MRGLTHLGAVARAYRWALIGGGVVAGLALVRVAIFAFDPSDAYVAAVPDDAFYYIQLARHMAAEGRWTFDGTAPATGFHPLYAYLLVALERVAGDVDARTLLVAVGVTAALALGASAALTGITSTRHLGPSSVPFVVAVFSTPFALMHATHLMESWLALLLTAATVTAVSARRRPDARAVVAIGALGLLGSLARSDYGLLPFALMVGGVATLPLTGWGPWIARSSAAFAGAVLGLGLVTLQNYLIAGELVQASVRMKSFWAAAVAHASSSPPGPFDLPFTAFTSTFTPYLAEPPAAGLLCLGLAAGIPALVLIRVRRGDLPPATVTLALSSVLGVAGYLVVYSRNADLQFWYTASFMVPAALLLACLGRAVLGGRLLRPGLFVAAVYAAVGIAYLTAAPWPNQVPTREAAADIRATESDGPIGAWNAGVLAYFSGSDVVNLDGLVNDDAVPYILSGDLADYVESRGITRIVDYAYMFDAPRSQIRGGYADGRLIGCLSEPTRVYSSPDVSELQYVEVRSVIPGCLAR